MPAVVAVVVAAFDVAQLPRSYRFAVCSPVAGSNPSKRSQWRVSWRCADSVKG